MIAVYFAIALYGLLLVFAVVAVIIGVLDKPAEQNDVSVACPLTCDFPDTIPTDFKRQGIIWVMTKDGWEEVGVFGNLEFKPKE